MKDIHFMDFHTTSSWPPSANTTSGLKKVNRQRD